MAASENYRPEWFASVGLLRTVNDVVQRSVKESSDPVIMRVVVDARQRVEADQNSIYWRIMDGERNLVIHEYVFGKNAPAYLLHEEGGRILLEDGSGFLLLEEPNVDDLDAAEAWWQEQLDELESAIRQAQAEPEDA
jgi:hypothetical protein